MKEGNSNNSTPGRGWAEMLGFFIFVSVFVSLLCSGIGLAASFVYSPDSSVHLAYIFGSIAFALFLIITQIVTHVNHSRPMLPLYLVSVLGLAVFFYSFLFSIVYGIVLFVLFIFGIGFNEIQFVVILRILPIIAMFLILTYGILNARFLRRRRIVLPILKRNRSLKIILISDLHLGLLVGKTRLNAIMGTIWEEKPDIIILAGDFLDTNPRFLERFEHFVKDMVSAAPVFSVMGNHEFYNGMEEAMRWLGALGVEVLDNRSIRDERTGLLMIGINDPSAFKGNGQYKEIHEKLLSGLDEDETKVLINHQPILFHEAAKKGIDLQLSGHTHGGQMWPFGLGTRAMFKEGDRGLHRYLNSYLYVCQGTGTWGPPLRIGTTSEIIMIELKKK
jgi:hypothetical protein